MKKRAFYRVESMDSDGNTVGGYVGALFYLFSKILNVDLEQINEDLLSASVGSSPEFDSLMVNFAMLCDIPKPDEFINNRENYCLYQKNTFLEDEIYELQNITRKLSEMTNGEFLLICKKFMLTDDEIIYEDDFQVVITPEVYKRHNRNSRFKLLSEIEGR